MDVGIGLPNAVPGTSGEQLTEFARRAEARGFSTLGTIDRVAYSNYEPLTALAAAAAVTERIGLCTSVLLAPLRANAVALAKQTLSLQALSGGRLTLGVGIGGREDDFEVAGVEMGARGRDVDAMLERMREVWEGDEVGPPTKPPRLLVGGSVEASFERAARFGDGWIAGGPPPDQFASMREQVEAAWSQAGRDGRPQTAALAYFSLGERAEENAQSYLTDYYGWLGEETAGFIAASAAKDAETAKQHVSAYAEAGCEELILFPSSSDPEQADLLADALGL